MSAMARGAYSGFAGSGSGSWSESAGVARSRDLTFGHDIYAGSRTLILSFNIEKSIP